MKRFVFPMAVTGLIFLGWVISVALEPCALGDADPKFDCWSSIQIVAIFACIGSIFTGGMALLARLLCHPLLPFSSPWPEWWSALLASSILILLANSVLIWEIDIGHIGMQFFAWLGASFFVCGISLLIMKYLYLTPG